jgi:hypothetical protein
MAEDFSYLDDFPEYFYYGDLLSALKDLRLSDGGIHEITTKAPVTDPKDRKAVRGILIRVIADLQRPSRIIDLVWEHTVARWRELGFSEMGVQEIGDEKRMTQAADREVLLGVLTHWLVRNEALVPSGYPGHMRQLWKAKQLEIHQQKK